MQSILQFISSTFPKARVQVLSSNPAETAKQYQVETVPMVPAGFRSFIKAIFSGSMRKTLRAYKQADAVIFGGGGLFTDEKPHAIFIWIMQILPAFCHKKPVMCIGQSVGPLFMRSSRWAVRKVFKKIKIVTVRDDASRTILNKMGIENIHVIPDPVFGLHSYKPPHASQARERKPYVVFSLRPWIKNAEKNRKILAEFVDWMFETYHLKTYFVPFQSAQDNDEKESLQVFSKLEQLGSGEVLAFNEKIPDILNLMEEATLVVGMRLHSIIFSTLAHTPFLALSYSLKVAEIAKQLDMEEYLSEYRFVDLEVLKKKFKKLFSERVLIQKKLAAKHLDLDKKTGQYSALLQELCS